MTAVVDINGDGKPEFRCCKPVTAVPKPRRISRGSSTAMGLCAGGTLRAARQEHLQNRVGRVNGDGVPDVVAFSYNSDGDIAYQTFIDTAVRTVPSEPVARNRSRKQARRPCPSGACRRRHRRDHRLTGHGATVDGRGGRVTVAGAGSPARPRVDGAASPLLTAAERRGTGMPSARSRGMLTRERVSRLRWPETARRCSAPLSPSTATFERRGVRGRRRAFVVRRADPRL